MHSHFGAINLRKRCTPQGIATTGLPLTESSVYQEYLAKTLTDKYTTLNMQMDKVINDANSELNVLNQKLNGNMRNVICVREADL